MKMKNRILKVFAAVLLGLTIVFSTNVKYTEAGFLCQSIGSNLGRSVSVDNSYSKIDKGNYKWTADKLFGGATTSWSTFYGEGEETFWFTEKDGVAKKYSSIYNDDVKDKFENSGLRSVGRCTAGSLGRGNILASFFNILTRIVMTVGNISMSALVNPFIIDNIVEIVGGKSAGDSGLIGALTEGIYMPLVFIAVLFFAGWVIYKGLIKREFRNTLQGILWSALVTVMGVGLIYNPKMIATAPQKATTTITDCVVGAMAGENCLTGKSNDSFSEIVGPECAVNPGDGLDRKVESLNCSIWKTFSLNSWAQGQFGVPYNELYVKTTGMPEGGKLWEGASKLTEEQKDTFCLSLTSPTAPVNQKGHVIETSGGTEVCNLALYHLYLKTPVEDVNRNPGNGIYSKTDNGIKYNVKKFNNYAYEDPRFYNLASALAAHDEAMFNIWAGKSGGQLVGSSIMDFIAVTLAVGLLTVLAVFGAAYQVTASLTIVFAPIFLLFALHPGRGRKIFLGWLETILSSIMKYSVSLLFAVIALVMYSAVLQNTAGPAALISVLVLSSALYMYRGEVLNLLGAVNLGGERMKNMAAQKMQDIGKTAKDFGTAAAGGALGASLAEGKVTDGVKDSLSRELRRGTGFVAQTAKQKARTEQELKNEERTRDAAREAEERREEKEQADKLDGSESSVLNEVHHDQKEEVAAINEYLKDANTPESIISALREMENDEDINMELAMDIIADLPGGLPSDLDIAAGIAKDSNPKLNEVDYGIELIKQSAIRNGEVTDDMGNIYKDLTYARAKKIGLEMNEDIADEKLRTLKSDLSSGKLETKLNPHLYSNESVDSKDDSESDLRENADKNDGNSGNSGGGGLGGSPASTMPDLPDVDEVSHNADGDNRNKDKSVEIQQPSIKKHQTDMTQPNKNTGNDVSMPDLRDVENLSDGNVSAKNDKSTESQSTNTNRKVAPKSGAKRNAQMPDIEDKIMTQEVNMVDEADDSGMTDFDIPTPEVPKDLTSDDLDDKDIDLPDINNLDSE